MTSPYRAKMSEDTQLHQISGATWLLTFSDLLTLLITLFVMRYAMTAVDAARWERLTSSVRSAMHAPKLSEHPNNGNPALLKLTSSLKRVVPERSDGIIMTLRQRKKSLSIELSGSVFFGDTPELTFSGKERLHRIAAILVGQPVNLEVTAHAVLGTDPDSPFASPWDLSAAWAGVVTRQMIDGGISTSVISAAGLADIQQDEDRDLAKPTRRIEIAITLSK